jgi:hypothetical protein
MVYGTPGANKGDWRQIVLRKWAKSPAFNANRSGEAGGVNSTTLAGM